MDVEILSRLQFAFTITFHYIYPPLSIGIALAMVIMEGMYLKTRDILWEKLTKFWLKVFAMTFALGVATGIPMMFSLGTNWSRYSRFVSDVSGSLVGMEGMFAFLIEAGFLGILLFGWNKVSPKMHFMSTILVCVGAHFSAIWIVSFNSWMQTPAGHRITTLGDGTVVAEVVNWWKVFLSPSNLSHLTHVLLGCWMTGAFLILSVAAYYLLKKKHRDFAIRSMKVALAITLTTSILQLVSADHLARKVATYNPEKFAAFEGVYKTEPYTPAYAIGWVDAKNEKVYGLSVPGMLSWMTYRDASLPVPGLDQFPKDQWAKVPVVFQMYHLMIFMWVAMTVAAFIGGYYWWKKRWDIKPIFLKFMMISVLFPQIANIAGWYSSCIGRQPWTVYKLLKTADAFSPVISKGQVIGSLIMFVVMYTMFFILFLVLLNRKIKAGPVPEMDQEQLPYRDIYKREV